MKHEEALTTSEKLSAQLDVMIRLHRLSSLSITEGDLQTILYEIIDAAIAITGAEFGNVQLIDPISSVFRTAAQRGFPDWWFDFWNNAPKSMGSCARSCELRERVIVEDVERSAIFDDTVLEMLRKAGVRAVQSTPLIARSGKLLGVFSTHYKKTQRPDEGTLRLLDLIARQAADSIENIQVITERKEAEEALRSSEERLRHALTAASAGTWERDFHSGGVHWSRETYDLYGLDPEDGQPSVAEWRALVHPDDVAFIEAAMEDAINKDGHYRVEFRIRHVRNGERWLMASGQVTRALDGTPIRMTGISVDITDRKQAEEAARRQASLLQLSFDAIIVWRLAGGIESWNRGAETLYGFTEREAIRQHPPDLLKTVFPVSWCEVEAALKDQGSWEGELRHRTKDGRDVIVSARFQCINGGDGVARVLEINRDITARKQLEEERAQEQRRKDEFLGLLGHELRNPLAAISTAIHVLSGAVSVEQRAALNETMSREVMLMRRLLDDLLDLTRITHGQIELKKRRIDLARFLQQVIAVAQPMAAERRQEIFLRLPTGDMTFVADEARVEQIAMNLLNNASRYTGEGGRIEFSGYRENSEIVFRCKDSGQGIPASMLEKIFEPFIRLEPLGNSPGDAGLGIGLALVKRLAELHGGMVSVESGGPGLGSQFTVRLPLESAHSDLPADSEVKPVPALRRPLTVVVIEDNSDVAAGMAAALKQAGHQATVFGDAAAALTGLSCLKPDAVLLDVGLPGMDGCELAAKLRKNRNLKHTLFVGLSGFRKPQSVSDFDYYFTKPVDLPALLTLLDTSAPVEPAKATMPLRTLLIEDHPLLSAATAELLRSEGFEVQPALSGQQALDAASGFKPQLTLCDLSLPDIGGIEVIRRLRSNPFTRHTYMVIVTALSEQEIRELKAEAKDIGFDDILPKPLTREAIRALVDYLSKSETIG